MLDNAEIVGDKEVSQVVFLLKILEQVDDLGLDGEIEGRDRFVGDYQARLYSQGAGDADALTLAA